MDKNVAKALVVPAVFSIAFSSAIHRLTKTRPEDDPSLPKELLVTFASCAAIVVVGHKTREYYGVNRATMTEDLFKK